MVSSMGLAAQTATTDSTTAATVVNTLSDRRSQVSGVSLDEEMTNLVKFQHAYAAAGRAMSTMNDMLDSLDQHGAVSMTVRFTNDILSPQTLFDLGNITTP